MSESINQAFKRQIVVLESRISTQGKELALKDVELIHKNYELARMRELLAEKDRRISLLEERVAALSKKIFGASSEALDSDQLQFIFQEVVIVPVPSGANGFEPDSFDPAKRKPCPARRVRKPRVPEHLPVIEEVIVPLEVQLQPSAYRKIGEEVSDRLDFTPGKFSRLRTIRPKYVKIGDADAAPIISKLPPCILEGSILTPGLLAQVLTAKYVDHLPLYRQEQIYKSRHGVPISRQSMSNWVAVAADWCQLIYERIKAEVLSGGYIQVDETSIPYLQPGNGETKKGWLWVMHAPGGGVVFYWCAGRGAERLAEFIPKDFKGVIQCDGYTAYDRFARSRPMGEIELAACWAHARRYFVKARTNAPRQAGLILYLMQALYRVEKDLRKSRASPVERSRIRSLYSRPILRRIKAALDLWDKKQLFLPKSTLGEAIQYALNQWKWLLPYIDNGRLEIDSNLVENAIRPTAIGKKNYMFFGAEEPGQNSAVIYTLVETCRKLGIDPYEYLRDIFTKLPTTTNWDIKNMTPAAWLRARQKEPLKAAA